LVVGGLLIHEPLHSLDVIAMPLILSGVCVLQTGKQLVPVEPAQ
jgi:multidrug transporter EmrE-like cation transporter